jgi:DUF4097 and DUF4098 domain-containing protein YvlB
MHTSITPTVKIVLLVLIAIVFATTLIALSVQTPFYEGYGGARRHFDKQTQKYSESFNVQKGGILRLDTDVGGVTVTGGDVSTVQVTVNVKGAESDVKEFTVKFNQTDQGVEIVGRYRDHNGWHFNWRDFDAHYEVVVPADFNLNLETSGGDIVVSDIRGTVRGQTSGGDVEITGITGDINLETSGGDIRLRQITGTVVSETSGGDIDGTSLTGDVRVETSGGNIDLREVNGKTVASTSGGNVRMELVEYKGVDASTSGGNITIRLPGSAGADIHAETVAGSVHCDFPFQGSLDDGTLDGTINGGGQRLRAETSGGDISIRKR